MHFAIIEDEHSQLELIEAIVWSLGHDCHRYTTGSSFIEALKSENSEFFLYDLLIIDWELPDIKGPEIVRWVRENKSDKVPIIFVTNRRDERDLVYALSTGADDFICKPTPVLETIARIKSLLHRGDDIKFFGKYEWGGYVFFPKTKKIEMNGEDITLKNKEFELALFLFQNMERLISRQQIHEQFWGGHMEQINSHTLDTHISAIRSKLQIRPENGYRLISVYGCGYKLEPCIHSLNHP